MLTVGSRGDVQPLIAFGHGLQQVGHEVRIATYPRFESLVREQGIDFAPLAEGALSLGAGTEEGRRWQQEGARLPTWVGFIRDARSVAHRRLRDAEAACRDTDVVVASNLAQVLGWQMADHFGIPLVRVLFHAPTYWMSRHRARRLTNAGRQAAWLAARPWLNAVRREALDLPALPRRQPFRDLERRGALALAPFSPAAFGRPPGWDGVIEVTGYWFLDGSLDPDPPPALVEFLESGPAPVYVGFGTQVDPDPPATTRAIVDALARAGRRGVLLREPSALAGVTLPPDVIAVEAVSHTWLFPRCAAVVHHTASGTTAASLRAGIPTVPVPHNSDQFSWAREVHRIGVGTKPIPRRRLTTRRLEAAITMATTDGEMQERARAIGEAIAAEDGVARAVEAFQDRVASETARPRGARFGTERGDSALITGASSGIGETFARTLAARGVDLLLTAHPAESRRLEEIAAELGDRHGVRCVAVPADLAERDGPDRLRAAADAAGFEPDLLVNNAGVGYAGRFHELGLADQLRMLHVNVEALVALTGLYAPRMVERGGGAIVNVASTAAFQPVPYFSVYAASKAFVVRLSEALWAELHEAGVRVVAVCSGP
ncbi:MAG TPA: SDR family NAD(P)-dependent oxidoreductase, partial [Capillimicrobium sp.]|nr:SDR family NAD(P)-dependent oxidoreductase [Capillimicrobium sp.]